MGAETKIEWAASFLESAVLYDGHVTDLLPGHTFNAWWGCTKISPGCKHCYAETTSNRWGMDLWGPNASRKLFSDKHWNEPLKWNAIAAKAGIRLKVFCNSMADWLEDRRDLDEPRERLFKLIEDTPNLMWLLLTKRMENAVQLMPERWRGVEVSFDPFVTKSNIPQNIMFGASICTNDEIRPTWESIHNLLLMFKVRPNGIFISMEPLLEPLMDLGVLQTWNLEGFANKPDRLWIIVGGESGKEARPMHPDWVRDIRDFAKTHNHFFFFKQWGEWLPADQYTDAGLWGHDLMGGIYNWSHSSIGLRQYTLRHSVRTGKGKSGRLLDTLYHNEMPDTWTID